MIKDKAIYKVLLVLILLPVLAYAAWCGYTIRELTAKRSKIKKEYSEINNIQHGLLSVDSWRDHVSEIVSDQIDAFDLTEMQEDTLKTELNKILNSVVTKANTMINQKQEGLGNKIKMYAVKQFVDEDKIRQKVPQFSQTIVDELKKPSSKLRLKFLAKDKFREFADKTHDSLNTHAALDAMLAKYKANSIKDYNSMALAEANKLEEETYQYTFSIIGCLLFFLLLWLILKKQKPLHATFFIMSVILALITLFIGLAAPMIEIDARIKELNFLLIGRPLVFNDQVIFYQSKSIIDVVHILIATGKADSIFVGGLILIFSIFFPITKLICTQIYLLGGTKTRTNKFLIFFAFKSGKWSMADVMVVAIFMAFVGFNGILNSQMESLNFKTDQMASIATNETSLQPGVILFICYVIFGLILGAILKSITFKGRFDHLSISRLKQEKSGN